MSSFEECSWQWRANRELCGQISGRPRRVNPEVRVRSPVARVRGALYALIKVAIDNEDVETAIKSAVNLYQLTGDEEIGDIARNLIKAVEEAQAEADAEGE